MSEALAASLPAPGRAHALLTVRIGWRNLWRNPRRTWLTAGGIAFAVTLVVSFMALQEGQYEVMIENATGLMTGQIQIQTADYIEDSRFEDVVPGMDSLMGLVESTPGVAALTPRVEAFALASADERSFGAQVLGIDISRERETVRLVNLMAQGRAIDGPGEAVLGTVLARNLGVGIGGEVVVLGAGKEGGVAAMVLNVVGLMRTGMAEPDRVIMLAHIGEVQEAFGLEDEAHTIVIQVDELDDSTVVAARLRAQMPDGLQVRNWDEVLPELVQGIEADRIGGRLFFTIILVLVVFSVVNTFIMTVFERTREFGMLRAIGLRPFRIIMMVQWEALFVCAIGVAIGLAIAGSLIAWLGSVGLYLGEQVQEYAAQFYMTDRMYPAFSVVSVVTAPLVMFIGTQLAAIIPSLRIWQLKPVEALREQ
jgi:ABC-type lipoprotein release transport system permease subunit